MRGLGPDMALINRVMQHSFFGALGRKDAEAASEAARIPSLASVEYELAQLRSSLRGYVDFGGDDASASDPQTAATGERAGLSRNAQVQMAITR